MNQMQCVVMLAGFAAVMGCSKEPAGQAPGEVTAEDVRRDAGQAAKTAAEYSQQAKDEFQKKLEGRLTELDAEIVKLREKGTGLKDEAKAKWEKKLPELEAKREAVRAKLAELGQSSAAAWKDVQSGAQSAWDELEKAFGEASREF